MLSTFLSKTSLKRLQNQNVDIESKDFCKLSDIFIVTTVERSENCHISHAFSTLIQEFNNINYLDLGSINQEHLNALDELKTEVHRANKVLIVLTPNINSSYALNSVIVTERPSNKLKHGKNQRYIAYQRHFLAKDFQLDTNINKSLGEVVKNISIVEPLLRSCKSLYFQLSAIKSTELSEFGTNFNPVGLSILQSCQIARYAGFSKKLKYICISNFSLDSQAHCHTIALWLWYYMEGKDLDQEIETQHPDDTTSYIVNSSVLDTELEFIKENKSERWWLINPDNLETRIPCMYEDYLAVINENSEDKILELLKSANNAL